MTDSTGPNEQALASAASELQRIGKQTLEARAVLATLERTLVEAQGRISDRQKMAQLLEANEQLVIAVISAQSEAAASLALHTREDGPQLLREANEQLVIAALSAQSLQVLAERALGQERKILALVAHELRTPLTPISMIAGRIARAPSGELPKLQALLEGQVQYMARLVDDLLDVSRASTGKLRLKLQPLDIVALIRSVVDNCLPVLNARQLQFLCDLPGEGLFVSGDPVRLTQVIANILTNAAKYTPPGGIVTLSARAEEHTLIVSIADNGIGISSDVLQHIFEPFVQDEQAAGFNGTGLGIGLAVVRELVEAHGGTVVALSDGQNRGSTFIITLPLVAH
ncbi:sensor histidine kinase [Pseudomonas typographi]|uniref:histidine kinase n=1 Tax=Pseudomonas typographi TaxID=2715964 RepID=A0ABR7Z6Q1_9PSED|nr:HAMP domain-containing sensor histidine kinase [Pseudomonas typographi]MBD1589985.1 HAMP domain-containing histidine kinase [Pseudomonas typographi]MBD1601094.1 HAMP domain-containing histidine kinase [Pseudomonas typographi]